MEIQAGIKRRRAGGCPGKCRSELPALLNRDYLPEAGALECLSEVRAFHFYDTAHFVKS
jgi:hypothetical protein